LNLTQQQLDEELEHQNQMLRHQELLLQKKNELRLLEERISTNKQIIEHQQQQLLQQLLNHLNKKINKKWQIQ
jgi:uncharacterized protein YdhG (YjbR/CyaY superfamily)